jgi:hypothetical protein
MTTLRSSLSLYVFFVHNTFSLVSCFVNSLPEVDLRIDLVILAVTFHQCEALLLVFAVDIELNRLSKYV